MGKYDFFKDVKDRKKKGYDPKRIRKGFMGEEDEQEEEKDKDKKKNEKSKFKKILEKIGL